MKEIIDCCRIQVEEVYSRFDASHDMDHIRRVLKNARLIADRTEGADRSIIELAVLLHDIDDPKYQTGSHPSAETILTDCGADEKTANEVMRAIESISFRGGNEREITSVEGAIVRDADRLDAIGAIGIARAFAYGGAKNRKLYDSSETIREQMTEDEYRVKQTATVTHFHEKLLLLQDKMITEEGKRIAADRHAYMTGFLRQLSEETGENLL